MSKTQVMPLIFYITFNIKAPVPAAFTHYFLHFKLLNAINFIILFMLSIFWLQSTPSVCLYVCFVANFLFIISRLKSVSYFNS